MEGVEFLAQLRNHQLLNEAHCTELGTVSVAKNIDPKQVRWSNLSTGTTPTWSTPLLGKLIVAQLVKKQH
jgi:hypothetical protein